MTSQTKKFIELSDILALHFECKNNDCKATLTLSASQDLRDGTLYTCPVCEKSWAVVNGGGCELTIKEFLRAYQKLQKTLGNEHGSFPAGFLLRLEILEEAESESSGT